VARLWERRRAYRVLVGKPEEKSPPGKPSSRLEDNIKMNLHVIGKVDWIDLAQVWSRLLTLLNAVMNFQVSVKCGEFLD
jgi:hypothetical protein